MPVHQMNSDSSQTVPTASVVDVAAGLPWCRGVKGVNVDAPGCTFVGDSTISQHLAVTMEFLFLLFVLLGCLVFVIKYISR